MIYPFALQIDINLHDNSRTYRNPSNETCHPISINKHLLGSLTQQQTYSDIQPERDATEFKTLVLKYKRSLTATEGDENHNETKKYEILCINSP